MSDTDLACTCSPDDNGAHEPGCGLHREVFSPQRQGRADPVTGAYHPSAYDLPTPPGGPRHWWAKVGHHPDCPACAAEQETAERRDTEMNVRAVDQASSGEQP